MLPRERLVLGACDKLLGGFPSSYVVFDTETTGFKKDDDLIWNFALLEVVEGRIAASHDLIFDWTHASVAQIVDQSWLRAKIDRQQANMGPKSKLSLAALRTGLPPGEGLQQMLQLLDQARLAERPFAGHGIINFDIPRIAFQLEEWLGIQWRFGRRDVIDTAALEKALVVELLPRPSETLFDFSRRVLAARKTGAKWSLDEHCAAKYDLLARTKLAQDDCHWAVADCKLCHELLSVYRQLAQGSAA